MDCSEPQEYILATWHCWLVKDFTKNFVHITVLNITNFLAADVGSKPHSLPAYPLSRLLLFLCKNLTEKIKNIFVVPCGVPWGSSPRYTFAFLPAWPAPYLVPTILFLDWTPQRQMQPKRTLRRAKNLLGRPVKAINFSQLKFFEDFNPEKA